MCANAYSIKDDPPYMPSTIRCVMCKIIYLFITRMGHMERIHCCVCLELLNPLWINLNAKLGSFSTERALMDLIDPIEHVTYYIGSVQSMAIINTVATEWKMRLVMMPKDENYDQRANFIFTLYLHHHHHHHSPNSSIEIHLNHTKRM